MTSLYTNPKVKALVNIAHGEGFGLPLFEAAREALPVVTVGWSGQTDFLTHEGKDYFTNVGFTIEQVQPSAVWQSVIEADSKWANAKESSYKQSIRKVYENWDEAKNLATELQEINNTKFSTEKLNKLFVDSVLGFDSSLIEPSDDEEVVLEFD
jgi:glycosyltransferase involved in cell wall biosynthesis